MSRPRRLARFPGRCRRCREAIDVGEPIFWEAGVGAEHVECPENDGGNEPYHAIEDEMGFTPGDA